MGGLALGDLVKPFRMWQSVNTVRVLLVSAMKAYWWRGYCTTLFILSTFCQYHQLRIPDASRLFFTISNDARGISACILSAVIFGGAGRTNATFNFVEHQ